MCSARVTYRIALSRFRDYHAEVIGPHVRRYLGRPSPTSPKIFQKTLALRNTRAYNPKHHPPGHKPPSIHSHAPPAKNTEEIQMSLRRWNRPKPGTMARRISIRTAPDGRKYEWHPTKGFRRWA